jgi:hypothetical protein
MLFNKKHILAQVIFDIRIKNIKNFLTAVYLKQIHYKTGKSFWY